MKTVFEHIDLRAASHLAWKWVITITISAGAELPDTFHCRSDPQLGLLVCRKLKQHENADVARISKALVDKWKAVVLKTNTS